MVYLEAVKQVDNASKLMQVAVSRVSAQQQKMVESILQVVQTAINDATQNHMRLDSKLADVILMRVASVLENFKSSLADPINASLAGVKKEILDKLEDISEGFFSKFVKQYLAQQIVNLIQDPATKDDIEDLKQYLGGVLQESGVFDESDDEDDEESSGGQITVEERRSEAAEERRKARLDSSITNISNTLQGLFKSINEMFTTKVVPAVVKDQTTTRSINRTIRSGFSAVNSGITGTASYLKKNITPQFGILKGVMLTAVLLPIMGSLKDILGTVAKVSLITTGIIFLYKFFSQKKGFFDYLSSGNAWTDMKAGWKGIFDFIGDAGSILWDSLGGLLDPIFKKIGEWLEPKITEWANKFISKLDIGKLGFGGFGDLKKIAEKVVETLKPITNLMDDRNMSFIEAAIAWWSSKENEAQREKVQKFIRDQISEIVKIDLGKISTIIEEIEPIFRDFKEYSDERIRNRDEISERPYAELIADFILERFGINRDTLSKAIENIANLDIDKIKPLMDDISKIIPSLVGSKKNEGDQNADASKKSLLGQIMAKIWDDFINESGLKTVIDVLKKLADEIQPSLMKKGFSGYLSSIVQEVMKENGLVDLKTALDDILGSYNDAKKKNLADNKNSNDRTQKNPDIWRTWFKTSGLKDALEIELPETINKAFNSFLTKNSGMKALLGADGLVVKLNRILENFDLGGNEKSQDQKKQKEKDESNELLGGIFKGVTNAVVQASETAKKSAGILGIVNKITDKLDQVINELKTTRESINAAHATINDIREKLANYSVFGAKPFKALGSSAENQVTDAANPPQAAKPPSLPSPQVIQKTAENAVSSTVKQQVEGVAKVRQERVEVVNSVIPKDDGERPKQDKLFKKLADYGQKTYEQNNRILEMLGEKKKERESLSVPIIVNTSESGNPTRLENYA